MDSQNSQTMINSNPTNNLDKSEGGDFKVLPLGNIEIIVHAIRILTKLAMIVAIYYGNVVSAIPLTVHIISSEILDQLAIYFSKIKPEFKKFVPIFYTINSLIVISAYMFFTGWIINDVYLIFIIHISSVTLGYGYKAGLISFLLSSSIYSSMLYRVDAPAILYLRIPIFSIFVLRLFTSQYMYEKTNNFLNHVLNIEKSKQDFIAIASHNLRTPVAAIYGYIELLLRGDAGNLNDDQALYIKRIRGNNQELEGLTEKLLQISIMEIGKEINLFKQPSQIEMIIEDMVAKYSSVAKSKKIELKFVRGQDLLPLVNIDIEKINVVVANLIDNALKYTEKGKIEITAYEDNDFVNVSVRDTGIGISSQDLPKIFNKFYRSGNILVYNQVGAGLGLYLGKQIIELHGGKILVDSIFGQGSTFRFSLPIIKEEL